jgi:cytoskeletal protein CcmA (bactofilin family)
MLRRKTQGAADGFGGFHAEGTEIDGEVRFHEELRVDGKIGGRIYSENGRLLVGETGSLEAEIQVGVASISGSVTGSLYASSKVEIHATGKFYGTIHTPALIIEEGAIFEGQCEMATGSAHVAPAVVAEMPERVEAESKVRSA